jgi:hypothetical protein
MGYGIIELKCPNGHLWNIEWCSVGGFRQGPTKCLICGEEGKSTVSVEVPSAIIEIPSITPKI